MAIETVGDLIKKLQQFDPSIPVLFAYTTEAPYLHPVSFYETPSGVVVDLEPSDDDKRP